MITESSIYWILKLDEIRGLFVVGSTAVGVFACLSLFAWGTHAMETIDRQESSAGGKAARKYFFRSAIIATLLSISASFIPSTKQMAMVKVIPMIANSEIVGEMSADAKEIYKLGINAIKEQLSGYEKDHGKLKP